jgi:hypothetical protein
VCRGKTKELPPPRFTTIELLGDCIIAILAAIYCLPFQSQTAGASDKLPVKPAPVGNRFAITATDNVDVIPRTARPDSGSTPAIQEQCKGWES